MVYLNGRHSLETMKISGKFQHPPTFPGNIALKIQNPSPDSDLQPPRAPSYRTARRRPRTPATRLRKNGAPNGRRSRPETPLLKWKTHEKEKNDVPLEENEEYEKRKCRKGKKQREVVVSARKLATGLWRLQLPEALMVENGGRSSRRNEDRLGLQVT